MLQWWDNLTLVSQIFVTIAVPATLIMIIQSVLLLFGIGGGSDGDVDVDSDFDGGDISDIGETDPSGLSLISIRGIVAFFSVGGWVGAVCDGAKLPLVISVLLSFASGLAALIGVALLFKLAFRLQDSGNISIKNAIGKTAKVYIPIPAEMNGTGKVTTVVQERFIELSAATNEIEPLKTGETVLITSVLGSETVIVKRKTENNNQNLNGGISQWNQK